MSSCLPPWVMSALVLLFAGVLHPSHNIDIASVAFLERDPTLIHVFGDYTSDQLPASAVISASSALRCRERIPHSKLHDVSTARKYRHSLST